jgi:hypothetical protein
MRYIVIAFTFFVIVVIVDLAIQNRDIWMQKEVDRNKTKNIIVTQTEENETNQTLKPTTIIDQIRDENATIDLSKVKHVTSKEELEPSCNLELPLDKCLDQVGASKGDAIFIRIFKMSAELELWIQIDEYYQLLKVYPICKQSGYLGPKLQEGDGQGPEGFYKVTKEQLNPNSSYHLSFNLGFPNQYDKLHQRTGSALMVHGDCVSIGCYAMTDEKIEEIYTLVENALDRGQEAIDVHIFPFRMVEDRMLQYSDNEWYNFWGNLKEGYDYFEEGRIPPTVDVVNRRYEFE